MVRYCRKIVIMHYLNVIRYFFNVMENCYTFSYILFVGTVEQAGILDFVFLDPHLEVILNKAINI